MKVTAKCHNYSGCVLAYRGEIIELETGSALICPECGKPVVFAKPGQSWMKTTLLLSGAILILAAAGAFFALRVLGGTGKICLRTSIVDHSGGGDNGDPAPESIGNKFVEPPGTAEPLPPIVAPKTIEVNPAAPVNIAGKAEVLKRIDFIPGLGRTQKDRLYHAVDVAKQIGRVLTIPFGSGRASIAEADVQTLKAALEAPEVLKLRDLPTAVFVVLGYADSKGDEQKSLAHLTSPR